MTITVSDLEGEGSNCGVYSAVERVFARCGVKGPWEPVVYTGRPAIDKAKSATVTVEMEGKGVEAMLLAANAGGDTAMEFSGGLRGKRAIRWVAGTASVRLYRGDTLVSTVERGQRFLLKNGDTLNIALGFAVVLLLP